MAELSNYIINDFLKINNNEYSSNTKYLTDDIMLWKIPPLR
jgi:hypothetical protein